MYSEFMSDVNLFGKAFVSGYTTGTEKYLLGWLEEDDVIRFRDMLKEE